MRLEKTLLKDVHLSISEKALVVRLPHPYRVLSSAVLNGGLTCAKAIINMNVPKNYDHFVPKELLKAVCIEEGLNANETVGLMTAADLLNASYKASAVNDTEIAIVVTAGTSNAAAAGDDVCARLGTVNIIALIDGELSDACLVEMVKTITEAKALAFRELDIRSRSSRKPATGTTTDSIVIASSQKGAYVEYSGTATPIGKTVSNLTIEALKEAIEKQDGLNAGRGILQRLIEHGFSLEKFIEQLHRVDIMISRESLKESLVDISRETLLAAMLLACLRLDEDLVLGCIPDQLKNTLSRQISLALRSFNAFCYEVLTEKSYVEEPIPIYNGFLFTSLFLQSMLNVKNVKENIGERQL